jgi:hypothetical protein
MGLRERLFGTGSVYGQPPAPMGLRQRLFGGTRVPYMQPPIPQGESVQGVWTGARTVYGKPLVGGQWILTDGHLIFNPVDTEAPRNLLSMGSRFMGVPGAGLALGLLDKSQALEPQIYPLSGIRSFEPTGGPNIFSPPGTKLYMQDGTVVETGIVSGPLMPNWSPSNVGRRDHFNQSLQSIGIASGG